MAHGRRGETPSGGRQRRGAPPGTLNPRLRYTSAKFHRTSTANDANRTAICGGSSTKERTPNEKAIAKGDGLFVCAHRIKLQLLKLFDFCCKETNIHNFFITSLSSIAILQN